MRSKTDRKGSQVVRRERWADSLSDSSESMTHRRKVILTRRAEQDQAAYAARIEREVRRVEAEHEEREVRRIEDEKRQRMLEICGRDILPEDRRPPPPPPRESEVQYKGDYYYNRSYAERFQEQVQDLQQIIFGKGGVIIKGIILIHLFHPKAFKGQQEG